MLRLFGPAVSAEVDFYSTNFTVFMRKDREQGRVTDRDRGVHQVLADDRRGERTWGEMLTLLNLA